MKKSKNRVALANAFSKILNTWIPEKLFEVNLRNKEPEYVLNNYCATHDFCDPNQAMLDAFQSTFKRAAGMNKTDLTLINIAWNLAKHNEFKQINSQPPTKVKFLINDGEVFAYFPQLNYNKAFYGNTMKIGYVHIGQHTSVHIDYAHDSKPAKQSEYADLLNELISIGYTLKVLNK